MAQRHVHYEQAFEHYLRSMRMPYVAVDEARKALLPSPAPSPASDGSAGRIPEDVKSFDFLIAAPRGGSFIVDVKGRRCRNGSDRSLSALAGLETWVTQEDVEGLATWARLFGPGFTPLFVFIYALEQQPPDRLAESLFEFRGRWYFMRSITLKAYEEAMRPRSGRWRTLCLSAADFRRCSRPFSADAGRSALPVAGRSGRPYPHPHAQGAPFVPNSRDRACLRGVGRHPLASLGRSANPDAR
jgi:hypothetical protein